MQHLADKRDHHRPDRNIGHIADGDHAHDGEHGREIPVEGETFADFSYISCQRKGGTYG
ncbi:hypothetical protein D3C81_2320560 [compost metagenome]